MGSGNDQLPRLDLSTLHVDEFSVSAFYAHSEERKTRFLDQTIAPPTPFNHGGEEFQHIVSIIPYQVNDDHNQLTCFAAFAASAPAESSSPYFAMVRYVRLNASDIEDDDLEPQGSSDSEIFRVIESLGESHRTSVDVTFNLKGLQSDDLWFPLPARLSGESDPEDLFEISGIQGRKLDPGTDGKPQFRFKLDRTDRDDTIIELRFLIDRLSVVGIDLAIDRAQSFLRDLIVRPVTPNDDPELDNA